MFKVVLFESEEVEVVPYNWITENVCMWPSYMKPSTLSKAVYQKLKPDEDWTECRIEKIVYESNDINKANEKRKKIETMLCLSNLHSDVTNVERKKKRKRSCFWDSDDSSSGHEYLLSFRNKIHKSDKNTARSSPESENVLKLPIFSGKASTPLTRTLTNDTSPVDKDLISTVNKILDTVLEMKDALNTLQNDVNSLKFEQKIPFAPVVNHPRIPIDIPIDNNDMLSNLEKELNDETKHKSAVSYLAGLGGFSAKDHTFRALKHIFTHAFSLKVSWSNINTTKLPIAKLKIVEVIIAGLGGFSAKDHTFRALKHIFTHAFSLKVSWSNINTTKLPIAKLKIVEVIIDAIRSKFTDTSASEIENFIKSWLRNAVDRNGGRSRRTKNISLSL